MLCLQIEMSIHGTSDILNSAISTVPVSIKIKATISLL